MFWDNFTKLCDEKGLKYTPTMINAGLASSSIARWQAGSAPNGNSLVKLAEYLRDIGYNPQQVQDFYPTPSTMSTVMYYTGVDPRTMKPVYTPKNPHEKAMQRALMQYRNPANYELVKEALHIAGREDLIGFGPECLIKPRQFKKDKDRYQNYKGKNNSGKKDNKKSSGKNGSGKNGSGKNSGKHPERNQGRNAKTKNSKKQNRKR